MSKILDENDSDLFFKVKYKFEKQFSKTLKNQEVDEIIDILNSIVEDQSLIPEEEKEDSWQEGYDEGYDEGYQDRSDEIDEDEDL